MNNKTYDALKNLVLGGLPILITFLSSLNFEKATTIVAALTAALGLATIVASNIYDKNKDGRVDFKDLTDD